MGAMLLMVLTAMAQMEDPVKFTAEIKTGKTAEAEIVFSGRIEAGWHIYSTDLGSSGPTEASFHVNKADGIELVGKLMPRGKEKSHFDAMFGMNVRYFEGTAQFVQKIRFTKPTYTIDAYLEYGVCSDENCLPPGEVALKKSGKSPAVAAATEPAAAEVAEAAAPVVADSTVAPADSAVAPVTASTETLWWQPVTEQLEALDSEANIANHSLWYIFIVGLSADSSPSSCPASGPSSR